MQDRELEGKDLSLKQQIKIRMQNKVISILVTCWSLQSISRYQFDDILSFFVLSFFLSLITIEMIDINIMV